MVKNIFKSFVTEIFVSKIFSKVSSKTFGEKLLNILFSIKIENNIFNRFFTEIFVSPCVYKIIIYTYIYIVVLRQRFTKTISSALDSNHGSGCLI